MPVHRNQVLTQAEKSESSKDLPRSTPEEQGIDSRAIISLLDEIEQRDIGFHSLMIVRHDQVVAEGWWSPYEAGLKHSLYSLSKSFTSTAIGFAVQEGLLTLDDKVVSFFPEDLPEDVSDDLAAMDIRHLLTMASGHMEGTIVNMFQSGRW